ncbi:MAG: hypothetical protein U0792_22725 [Gemmataceae bacterium]
MRRWIALAALCLLAGCDEKRGGTRVYPRNDGQVTQVKYSSTSDWSGQRHVKTETHRYPDQKSYEDANTGPWQKVLLGVGSIAIALILSRANGGNANVSNGI